MSGQDSKQTSLDTSYGDGTRQHLLLVDGEEATDREYARVLNAQPYSWTDEEIQVAQEENASRPFCLMR